MLAALSIALTLFVFIGFISNVHAEEVTESTPESTTTEVIESSEVVETTEATETTTAEEAETTETTADTSDAEAVGEQINSLFNWFKKIDMDQVRVWFIAFIGKLVTDTGLILSMLIYFVKSKIKEGKESKYYNELISKLDAEHQKKLEEYLQLVDSKLEENNKAIAAQIKKQNSDERETAKANVDAMKSALEQVKVDLDE